MTTILSTFIPIISSILVWWIDRKIGQGALDKAAKQSFLNFMETIMPAFNDSVRLRRSVQDQINQLNSSNEEDKEK